MLAATQRLVLVPNTGVSAKELESITLDQTLVTGIGAISVTCAVDTKCALGSLSKIAIGLLKGNASFRWGGRAGGRRSRSRRKR
jgi:hypothetical protein